MHKVIALLSPHQFQRSEYRVARNIARFFCFFGGGGYALVFNRLRQALADPRAPWGALSERAEEGTARPEVAALPGNSGSLGDRALPADLGSPGDRSPTALAQAGRLLLPEIEFGFRMGA